MKKEIELKVRKSVRNWALKHYLFDVCKAIFFCAALCAILYFATKENKILNFQVNPVALIICYILIFVILIWRYRLWRVFGFGGWRGRVVRTRVTTTRVINRRINVGYVNGIGRDMMLAPSYEMTVQTADDKQYTIAMNDHLAGLGGEYLPEGSDVVLAYGAKFPWNAERLPERPYCIVCGYCGSPNEHVCTDCGCRMIPARLSQEDETIN